jgi:hypothetical protein
VQRLCAVAGYDDVVAARAQQLAYRGLQILIIFDD